MQSKNLPKKRRQYEGYKGCQNAGGDTEKGENSHRKQSAARGSFSEETTTKSGQHAIQLKSSATHLRKCESVFKLPVANPKPLLRLNPGESL
jgi:hypothetical protein